MTVELPVAFLIALYALNSSAIVAFVGIVVYLALRLGRLPTRQEHNELRNELKSDMAEFRREYKEDLAEFRREYKRTWSSCARNTGRTWRSCARNLSQSFAAATSS